MPSMGVLPDVGFTKGRRGQPGEGTEIDRSLCFWILYPRCGNNMQQLPSLKHDVCLHVSKYVVVFSFSCASNQSTSFICLSRPPPAIHRSLTPSSERARGRRLGDVKVSIPRRPRPRRPGPVKPMADDEEEDVQLEA